MIKISKTATFADWMAGLPDIRTRAKIAARIDRMALGHPGDVKFVEEGLNSLWIDYGPGYRVYFTRRSVTRTRRGRKHIVLLFGAKRLRVRVFTALTAKLEPGSWISN